MQKKLYDDKVIKWNDPNIAEASAKANYNAALQVSVVDRPVYSARSNLEKQIKI
jgi:hypothetical protein